MDLKRAQEQIQELANLVDQMEKEGVNKMERMPEEHKNGITVKIQAILMELDLRPAKYEF